MTTTRREGSSRRQSEGEPTIRTPSLFEVEAVAALHRATGHASALGSALDEAANALASTDLEAHARFLEKVRELHRYVSGRVDALSKRVTEGAQ